ncbi:two-component sensor histidine kinase [Petralouisia muris]|uniref:Two-component sensor histidine kinase n=1 Tax=Petralouisia muris TaxID=3032872 RepID=A0AC61RTV9_9FIRM|nr:ATP-binding protein [Petralouisia muris]TGY95076.1 two-component sensor histidine kinase [Petralouisia muris]
MKKRLNLQFIMASSFAVVITAVVSMMLFYNIFKNQVYDDIKDYTHIIQAFHQETQEWEKNRLFLEESGLRITLIRKDGSVEYDSSVNQQEMENHKDRPEIKEAGDFGEGTAVRRSATNSVHTFYYAKRLENGDIIRIGKDSENIFQMLKHTGVLIAVLSLFSVLLCGILSRYLTKRLLSPIEKLASNLDGGHQESVYEEIQPFIQTIRKQHFNILDHARMRQEFTANVSHELKTPLTAISGYAELIESGMAGEKDSKRFAGEIHSCSNRLLALINDILKLSELDAKEQEFDFEQVDLYQAAENCLDMMDMQAAKQGITLELKGKSCMISANRELIDELLYNLCSNGVRYNCRGGKVTVTVISENGRGLLSVKDTGIGISKEHQERIFERFYRVDKGRSRQNGGTGLGLAIVKHIVAQHKAEIMLESQPGVGTEVKVLF